MCMTDMTAPAFQVITVVREAFHFCFLEFFVGCLLLVDVRNSYHFNPSYG